MRRKMTAAAALFAVLSILVVACAAAGESEQRADLSRAAAEARRSGEIQMYFSQVALGDFIYFISETVQHNILVEPGVTGVVTMTSPVPVAVADGMKLLSSVLSVNGYALVDMDGYFKVVPSSKDIPPSGGRVVTGFTGPGAGDFDATQVVRLESASSSYVYDVVNEQMGKVLRISHFGGDNTIVISGRATDVQRCIDIMRALDVADESPRSVSFPVGNVSPSYVCEQLKTLGNGGPVGQASFAPDERGGGVIVTGTPRVLAEVEKVIATLDREIPGGNVQVRRLNFADAAYVAEYLSNAFVRTGQVQSPLRFVADEATNSVIISAAEWERKEAMRIIDIIDVQPKQIMIRGLIAEVNLTKLDKAGIDWATWGGIVDGDTIITTQGQLGTKGVPSSFVDWFQNLTKVQTEDSEGRITTTYEGKTLIYSYIDMLGRHDAINVLSMPKILCSDGGQSELQVGQVIPQIKAKTSEVSNPSSVQNSYEYKDTGLILKVLPRVRGEDGDFIEMEIEQRVEDVLSAMTSDTPVTAKREVKTSVLVKDGETVVIGGLMKDAEKIIRSRVPGISYIPLVGELFKSTAKQQEKISLIIFLTPEVVTEENSQIHKLPPDKWMDHVSEEESEVDRRLRELYRELIDEKGK